MDRMDNCRDGISHILTKDKTGGLFGMEDEIFKNKEDETDKFFETIEEREERLKTISTEVSQARGVEAKMEIMAKQIDLLATSLQFATINLECLTDEVNRLNKKNRKLKKQIKECFDIINGHTEYLGNVPEKLFRMECRIKRLEEQNKDLHEIVSHITLQHDLKEVKLKPPVSSNYP